jgi:hypothetical protein
MFVMNDEICYRDTVLRNLLTCLVLQSKVVAGNYELLQHVHVIGAVVEGYM